MPAVIDERKGPEGDGLATPDESSVQNGCCTPVGRECAHSFGHVLSLRSECLHLCRDPSESRRFSIECQRDRQVAVRLDLPLQIRNLLLRGSDGIGTGNEAARRWHLATDGDKRTRKFGRVARLLAALRFPELELLRSAFIVVPDGRLGEVRRLLREELRAA